MKPKAQDLLALIAEDPYRKPPPFEKLVGDLAGFPGTAPPFLCGPSSPFLRGAVHLFPCEALVAWFAATEG